MPESFSDYVRHGWKLCAIDRGQKRPTYADWNHPERAIPEDAADGLDGAGLMHAYSGTCAIDVDDMLKARPWLAERGIDIDELVNAPRAVRVESGRKHRTKLLYRLSKPLATVQPPGSGLEFRCGTRERRSVQDVLPPSVHPDTKQPYRWVYGDDLIGHWTDLQPLPPSLLNLWRELAGSEQDKPTPKDERPQASPEKIRQSVAVLAARKDVDNYEDWIDVGMRIHDETRGSNFGFDLWDQWSKGGKKYKGEADLLPHWLSFGDKAGPVKTLTPILRELPADPAEFEVIPPAEAEAPKPEAKQLTPEQRAQRKLDKAQATAYLEENLIYVSAIEKYFDLRRHEIVMTEFGMRQEFKAWMPGDGKGGKVDPITLLERSQSRRIARRFGFHPGEGPLYREDGELAANAYQNQFPAQVPPLTAEDRARIDWMFERIADPVYRQWLKQFFAHVVQRPGVRIFSAPLIWSKETGNGKSMLLEDVPRLLVGKRYSKSVNSALLSHPHNDYMPNVWHLCLPEFKAATMTERGSVVEMLKDWITAPSITVHPKGTKAYTMVARFFITATSNHPDAIKLENEERRWAIHQMLAAKMTEAEGDHIYTEFLSTDRAAGALRAYFLGVDLTGFNPRSPAPETADRKAMIDNSRGPAVDALEIAIEERIAPFDRDVVITREAAEYLQRTIRSVDPRRVGRMLVDEFGGEARQWNNSAQGKFRGVILRNHEKWRHAEASELNAHIQGVDDPLLL